MFRLRDPLAQNDVSEEDPMWYHFYGVLLRTGRSKQIFSARDTDFWGDSCTNTWTKHCFIQILWSVTEVTNVNLLPSFPTSYMLPPLLYYSCLLMDKRWISPARAVPSLVREGKNVFWLWHNWCSVTDVWVHVDLWMCICYPTEARNSA